MKNKMKTRKIVTKRFKLTKRGKLTHRVQGRRHLRANKSQANKRRQDRPVTLTNRKYINKIKQALAKLKGA